MLLNIIFLSKTIVHGNRLRWKDVTIVKTMQYSHLFSKTGGDFTLKLLRQID